MRIEIEITEEMLETYGSGTLQGTLMTMMDELGPCEIVLVFPQTTMSYRRRHGGPRAWVMNEFVVPCLLGDVLQLMERGFSFTVEIPMRLDM